HLESVDNFDLDSIKIDRGKIAASINDGTKFKRFAFTKDGISPRAFPGTPGMEFIAPSYEHDEYGNLVTDVLAGIDEFVKVREAMQRKRMSKIDTMLKQENIFVPEIENASAKHFLVAFG